MKTVAEAFRDARKATDKTQSEVAQMVGCTQGFIAQIEAKHRAIPAAIIAALPPEIRGPVIGAAQAELVAQIGELSAMAPPESRYEMISAAIGALHKML